MDSEKPRPKLTRTLTPSTKILPRKLTKASSEHKSQKVIIKHKPSNSYGSQSIPEKLLKKSLPKKFSPIKFERAKEKPKKLIVHRKSSSISEKPKSMTLASNSSIHKHKLSIDRLEEKSVILKYSYRSYTGFQPGNPSKVNQDAFIVHPKLKFDYSLFGVADGHGAKGEYVSGYIKAKYAEILCKHPYFLSNAFQAILFSASKLNKEIFSADFDTNFSGSTFVSVLLRGKKL